MLKAWDDEAWETFLYFAIKDKKLFNRIIAIIKDIERDLFAGIGKCEKLKGDLQGYYSRRIDSKNRIVYRIKNDTIEIIQCGSHYGDK